MSNDLISRSEAEQLLRAYADEVGCHCGEYELANGILKAACFLQGEENIPTAYDVDEVVERIKNCECCDSDGYLEPDAVVRIVKEEIKV